LAEIFISHASADNTPAVRVAEALRLAGHGVFLDSDRAEGIAPGAAWQRTLLRELRICDAVVFLNSMASRASMWCHSELVVATDLGKRLYSLDLGPDLLPHPLLGSVQGIVFGSGTGDGIDDGIGRLTASLETSGLAIRAGFRWERGRPPYPGLVAMDVADAGVFFGREDEVKELVARVDGPLGGRGSDLVVVMGPSGAGKSSLVRAGLAARLSGPQSGWAVVSPFEPGIAPLDRLVIRLAAVAPGQLDELACRARLGSEGLAAFGNWLAERAPVPARRLLIIVDQVEQLVSVTPVRERDAFLATLAGGLRSGSPVTVVLTVRSDRFDEIQQLPQLGSAIQAPFVIAPMGQSRLPMVIEGPAQRADLILEPGLAGRLADDAARGGGEAGEALPFLAFVLREMYDLVVQEDRTTFTHADYERTGRIEGAIIRRTQAAEAALPVRSESVLDHMLTRFVAVDEERQPTARLVQRASLNDAEHAVAEILADQRLVIGTAYALRLAHERLITAWPRLAAAVAERRDDLVRQARLERQAADWKKGQGELLGREATAYASSWLVRTAEPGTGSTIGEYIRASAVALRRRRTGVLAMMSVIVLLAVAASATAVVAVIQRSDAVSQSRLAQSEVLATEAMRQLPLNTPLAMLLSLQAYERAPTVQAGGALIEAAQQPLDAMLPSHSPVSSLAYSSDGATLAVGYDNGDIRLSKVATGRRIATFTEGSLVDSVALSPDGRTLAVGDDKGHVRAWDVANGLRLADFDEAGQVLSVTFSGDGQMLAAAGTAGQVILWNAATWHQIHTFTEGTPIPTPINSVAFSRDGKTLAAGETIGSVRLWRVATRTMVANLAEGASANSLAFSPDDRTLAVGDGNGHVDLWNVAKRQAAPLNEGNPVSSVAFSPDGRTLAVGQANGDVSFSDLTGHRIATVNEGSPVSGVAFSPDDRTLAAGGGDGYVGLWDVAGAQRTSLASAGPVGGLAFSPDSRTLAVGDSADGHITLWNSATGSQITTLTEGSPVNGVAFSPVGGVLAAGDDNGDIRLWNVATGLRMVANLNNGNAVFSVAFSRDGKTLAAGAYGQISLWDVATGFRRPATLSEGRNPVYSVAFSNDGRILAAGGDGYIQLWRVRTARLIATLKEGGQVSSVVYSRDGRMLAAGDDNGDITIWDVATRSPIATLTNDNPVSSVAFSPDGRTLAVGDSGGFVGLWDVASQKQLASIGEDDGGADAVISPDGQMLAAGGLNGRINLLRLNSTELTLRYFTRLICSKVGHNLTPSQWTKFVPGLPYQRTC
jgi:WD40 repeat protein